MKKLSKKEWEIWRAQVRSGVTNEKVRFTSELLKQNQLDWEHVTWKSSLQKIAAKFRSFKYFTAINKILHFLIILILLFSISYSAIASPVNLHTQAWNSAVNSEAHNKYSFYINRLLVVRHPEVYLKADMQILADIQKYRPDINIDWDWLKGIKTIPEASRYPKEMLFYPFLDRRLLPPTATLMRLDGSDAVRQKQMTPLEKAVIGYFLKKKDEPNGSHAIVYCSDNRAYLASKEGAVDISSMQKISLFDLACPVVFIMNEDDAYYPLMGRHPSDQRILEIIKKISPKQIGVVSISDYEMGVINHLKNLTALNSFEEGIAVLLAEKRGPILTIDQKYVTDTTLFKRWLEAFKLTDGRLETNIWRVHTGLSHLIMQEYNIIGNRLSPVAAYLADTSDCDGTIPKCFIKKFDRLFSWNLLWDWGFTSLSIDEANATGGGGVCAEQSSYAAAALDLMGVDYYAIHFTGYAPNNRKKDHRIIYVPAWDKTISNDKLINGFKEPNDYEGVVYVYHQGKWIFFDDNIIMGNLTKDGAGELISNFLEMIKSAGAEDKIACRAFGVEADIQSCKALQQRLGTNYQKVGASEQLFMRELLALSGSSIPTGVMSQMMQD